ncbi:MAG: cytochrome c oxidase subunit II [Gemmatimonadetes bacterium]|jgi:cytochrome c oxidase subunit 2|nr:cytochrome c oxidase subunit II [Gemmatimonadota bacterium]MED5416147.1 cytochrome c oxidase subunit II [Candidatus Latescibacterota bacterium]
MSKDFSLHPELASTFALQIDLLYFLLVAISVFFTVAIVAVIIFFVIKYRRKSDDERPKPIHGSLPLELAWSIIPFFICMGVFTLGADMFFRMYRAPADALNVYVVGKQWMWKVQHPEGKREINELHVPINTPIRLTMTSEDVIHAFSIPAFRTKRDVVPGRYNTMWFEATKVGEYDLFCAEYCGTQHSTMIGRVVVMEEQDYQNWLGGGAAGESMVEAGMRHFEQLGCATCHKSQSGGRGPTLTGVYGEPVQLASGEVVVADEAYIRESILRPTSSIVNGYQPIMPTFQGQISEETLLQLITYIKSLSEAAK